MRHNTWTYVFLGVTNRYGPGEGYVEVTRAAFWKLLRSLNIPAGMFNARYHYPLGGKSIRIEI